METTGQTMIKLWLDDVRTPPDETWTWVKTRSDALEYLLQRNVIEISFDHDLGATDTGYFLAKDIEHCAYYNIIPCVVWHIHSANPVGRRNIEQAMKSAERFWKSHKDN